MDYKTKYYALQTEIDAIAKQHGNAYLTDEGVDAENSLPLSWNDGDEFWSRMYASLCNSAGCRAEELGLNINELLGKSIY